MLSTAIASTEHTRRCPDRKGREVYEYCSVDAVASLQFSTAKLLLVLSTTSIAGRELSLAVYVIRAPMWVGAVTPAQGRQLLPVSALEEFSNSYFYNFSL
jgi:hypothetical protein